MGLFSWITREGRSISCKGSSRKTFTVWMHVPNNDHQSSIAYKEECYKGYGEFGGKDYYTALSEANPNHPAKRGKEERDRGIEIAFWKETVKGTVYPMFTETQEYHGSFSTPCESCDVQGYFYDDDDDENDDENDDVYNDDDDIDDDDDEDNAVEPEKEVDNKVENKVQGEQRACGKRMRDEEEEEKITCRGRTGPVRSLPEATVTKRPDGGLFIRVDDPNNSEFWLEMEIPRH